MRRVTAAGLKSAEPKAIQSLTQSRLLDSGIPRVLGTRNYCPNLKELRLRIGAIKNIKKITASMKMIAASKLNRQQQNLFKTRPYAVSSQRWVDLEWPEPAVGAEETLGKDQKRLLIDITSDRGLCGSVNTGVVKASIAEYKHAPEQTAFFLIGEKSKAALQREFGKAFTNVISEVGGNKKVTYTEVSQVADLISQQSFDTCTVLYTKFNSVLSSSVTKRTLPSPTAFLDPERYDSYEFEGDREELLTDLWQFNMSNLLYTSLVESQTSELGARMTSMDSATKNASEVLNKLTLKYNRQRQAAITTELTEIVSGAAAIAEQKS